MAGLSSTGIAGFIASAKFTGKKILNAAGELVSEVVSTFVSGVSGWMIQNNGDAEFKSIYARDKIVTNEYVYNRIRVTEDEEVITSNGKISSFTDNSDGTYTIYLDLREGDINPFADGDLLQGYYHSPEKSGIIYSVQKMTVQADPDKTDQSMIVTCEDGSQPYRYMIIVRVGNLFDTDRQSFIRISSRTNCQYFHDGINSFAALDNPDNIKCAIGKADIGLIPAWATAAIGNVRKWFGLIADGVILRGTFVLKSSGTTMEEELDGMAERFVDVETKFEIREGQISSKITQAEVYAENAEKAAQTATTKASEAMQTVDGFKQTVSESTTTINNAVKDAQDAASGAAGSASDAASKLVTITEKESSINQTAGEISSKVTEVTTAATNAANSASAAANSADTAANSAKTATTKASEAKQTADGFKQTVTEETKKAVDNAVAGADDAITEKVSTAVTQSAREWKVEVMGQDEQGNPNTILTAINADASGIKIKGEKVQITGELIAEIIKATGININDVFVIKPEASRINMNGSVVSSWFYNSGISSIGEILAFEQWGLADFYNNIIFVNISKNAEQTYILPVDGQYDGLTLRIFNGGRSYTAGGSSWTPRAFRLAYKINGVKQNFLGKYKGTDLTLELDQMAVITCIGNCPYLEPMWYVESYG